jgi:hypothetical protein
VVAPELVRRWGDIPREGLFNVMFCPRDQTETMQFLATQMFAERLADDDWTKRMLFPEVSHAIPTIPGSLAPAYTLKWIDPQLNHEQQVPPFMTDLIAESSSFHRDRLSRRLAFPSMGPSRHRQD